MHVRITPTLTLICTFSPKPFNTSYKTHIAIDWDVWSQGKGWNTDGYFEGRDRWRQHWSSWTLQASSLLFYWWLTGRGKEREMLSCKYIDHSFVPPFALL